ncbi:unnamed protein product [Spirodela intermedia]|uniref:Uncharacterized protein n=1 Tax=Spirodela intermedia TaxID=51605 RepID=A0ABN7EBE4_SPIIN|nr:unnamed protein product [Spirodela intermedia]
MIYGIYWRYHFDQLAKILTGF